MLFVWIGFLKPEVGSVPQSVQRMATDVLRQSSVNPVGGPASRCGRKMLGDDDDL